MRSVVPFVAHGVRATRQTRRAICRSRRIAPLQSSRNAASARTAASSKLAPRSSSRARSRGWKSRLCNSVVASSASSRQCRATSQAASTSAVDAASASPNHAKQRASGALPRVSAASAAASGASRSLACANTGQRQRFADAAATRIEGCETLLWRRVQRGFNGAHRPYLLRPSTASTRPDRPALERRQAPCRRGNASNPVRISIMRAASAASSAVSAQHGKWPRQLFCGKPRRSRAARWPDDCRTASADRCSSSMADKPSNCRVRALMQLAGSDACGCKSFAAPLSRPWRHNLLRDGLRMGIGLKVNDRSRRTEIVGVALRRQLRFESINRLWGAAA